MCWCSVVSIGVLRFERERPEGSKIGNNWCESAVSWLFYIVAWWRRCFPLIMLTTLGSFIKRSRLQPLCRITMPFERIGKQKYATQPAKMCFHVHEWSTQTDVKWWMKKKTTRETNKIEFTTCNEGVRWSESASQFYLWMKMTRSFCAVCLWMEQKGDDVYADGITNEWRVWGKGWRVVIRGS